MTKKKKPYRFPGYLRDAQMGKVPHPHFQLIQSIRAEQVEQTKMLARVEKHQAEFNRVFRDLHEVGLKQESAYNKRLDVICEAIEDLGNDDASSWYLWGPLAAALLIGALIGWGIAQ